MGMVTIPSTSSHIGPDQHSPWFLERAIGMKIVVERAGVHIAQFAADLWNAPGLVGHQILGIAQALGGHDPWPAATATAGAGGGQASLTRCRIRFRSISAKAAWICRKARPASS